MANEHAGRIQPVDEVQLLRAAACDWRLSRGDLGVFAVILEHCDGNLRAFPGPKLIATRARLSVTSVKSSIRQLEEWRYLKVERPGLRKRNRFQILPSPNVIPRSIIAITRELGLPSASFGKRGNWSRGVTQSSQRADHATGQAQRHPTGEACLHQLGKRARHEVALESTIESTTPAAPTSEDEEQRLKAYARRVYLDAKRNGNTTVMAMVESTHWMHVHDLADKGKLPPLEA